MTRKFDFVFNCIGDIIARRMFSQVSSNYLRVNYVKNNTHCTPKKTDG